MAAKKEKEVVKNEEAAKKEVETAKKEEEAAKVSESAAGIDDEQRDAKTEAKDAETPCLLGVVGDRFEMKTEKAKILHDKLLEKSEQFKTNVSIHSAIMGKLGMYECHIFHYVLVSIIQYKSDWNQLRLISLKLAKIYIRSKWGEISNQVH